MISSFLNKLQNWKHFPLWLPFAHTHLVVINSGCGIFSICMTFMIIRFFKSQNISINPWNTPSISTHSHNILEFFLLFFNLPTIHLSIKMFKPLGYHLRFFFSQHAFTPKKLVCSLLYFWSQYFWVLNDTLHVLVSLIAIRTCYLTPI